MLEKTKAYYEKLKEQHDQQKDRRDPMLEIDFNSDINATDYIGNTILIRACLDKQQEAVRELLAIEGIDIFKRNSHGNSALLMAAYPKQDDWAGLNIIRMLTNHPDFMLAERAITEIKTKYLLENEEK